MLSLDRIIGPINGMQVYRDHAEGNRFYYIPERPRVARNEGEPEFIFLKYRRDITDNPGLSEEQKKNLGGGLLAFTVDLGISDEVFDETRSELAAYSDGSAAVELGPVPFRAGSVRLSMISDKPPKGADGTVPPNNKGLKIFEHTWGAVTPSLYGNNRATFGLIMDHEAAVLMEAALKAGVGYVGVVYDLEFLGMRPAFNVKVTADYKRIYDHFEGELALEGQVYAVALKGQLAAGFQKLEDEGHLKIEVTTFTDNADLIAQANAARDWAQDKILTDLFKSSLQPPSFMTRSDKSPLDSLTGLLAGHTGGRDPNNSLQSRQPVETNIQNNPQVIDSQVPRPQQAPTNLGGTNHVQSPESQGTQTQTSSPTSTGMSPIKVGFSLKYFRQEELKKRVFEFSQASAEKAKAAPQGLIAAVVEGVDLRSKIIEVSLDDDFYKRLLLEVGTSTDFEHEGVELVTVSAEYPGERPDGTQPTHSEGYTFSAGATGRQEFMTWLNAAKDMSYRYAVEVHFKSTSAWVGRDTVYRSDWEHARRRPLIVNALDYVGLLDVEIVADATLQFGEDLLQAKVEVRYDDGDWEIGDTFLLDAEKKSHHWKLRLNKRDMRHYKYQVTYSFNGNVHHTTEWRLADTDSLIISTPFKGQRHIRVVPTFDADEIIEAVVDVNYVEPNTGYRRQKQLVFTPDDAKSKSVVLDQLNAEPVPYTYETTVVPSVGDPFESGPQVSESRVIAVGLGATETHRLTLRLATDAAALSQYYAVEVNVRGSSGSVDSEVFTASDAPPSATEPSNLKRTMWVASGKAGEPLKYEWRWVGYRRGTGEAVTSEWQVADDSLLVVSIGG